MNDEQTNNLTDVIPRDINVFLHEINNVNFSKFLTIFQIIYNQNIKVSAQSLYEFTYYFFSLLCFTIIKIKSNIFFIYKKFEHTNGYYYAKDKD